MATSSETNVVMKLVERHKQAALQNDDGDDAFTHRCGKCKYKTYSKYSLNVHARKKHPKVRKCPICSFSTYKLTEAKKHMDMKHSDSEVSCKKCSHVALSTQLLRLHHKKVHGSEGISVPSLNFVCRVGPTDGQGGECMARFRCGHELRKHLVEQHNQTTAEDKIEKKFATKQEFDRWKADYERRRAVWYVHSTRHAGTAVFVCNRSGVYTPTGSGLRRCKSQGSVKMGMKCTSALHMRREKDGTVSAVLYTHHHGHSEGAANLPHVRIPPADRALARAQLAAGLPLEQVMENMRGQAGDDPDAFPTRVSRMNRKDLQNIRRSLGVGGLNDSVREDCGVMVIELSPEDAFEAQPETDCWRSDEPEVDSPAPVGTEPSPGKPVCPAADKKKQLLAELARVSALVEAVPPDATLVLDNAIAKMVELKQLLTTAPHVSDVNKQDSVSRPSNKTQGVLQKTLTKPVRPCWKS